MTFVLAILIFVTVTLAVFAFGAAAMAPTSVLGSRLRALGWQRPEGEEKAALKERFEQALNPLSKALPLSASEMSRTRAWLVQPGYHDSRHLIMYCGIRMLMVLVGLSAAVLAVGGLSSAMLLVR